MADFLYIQEYYYYLIAFICALILLSFHSHTGRNPRIMIDILVTFFAAFTVYYFGSREVNIGVDTIRYEKAFSFYENIGEFEIRKDPFYDYLTFIFAQTFNFQALLLFCAFLYVFGALYAFKKIFKANYFLPFLVFLVYPYFIAWGVNVMRSGVAASLFLVGLGVYYDKGKKSKVTFWFLLSVLFHISMFVPLLFFFLTRFLKNTKVIFCAWLFSIVLGVLKINIIARLVNVLGGLASRASNYSQGEGEESSWINFLIFGFFPVVFAVYNIIVKKNKDDFYKWLVNAYMLTHIPYIVLINTQYASRLGYLAEFMMPIILLFPLLVNPEFKIRYYRLKLSSLIFCIFLVKAYKILVV